MLVPPDQGQELDFTDKGLQGEMESHWYDLADNHMGNSCVQAATSTAKPHAFGESEGTYLSSLFERTPSFSGIEFSYSAPALGIDV